MQELTMQQANQVSGGLLDIIISTYAGVQQWDPVKAGFGVIVMDTLLAGPIGFLGSLIVFPICYAIGSTFAEPAAPRIIVVQPSAPAVA